MTIDPATLLPTGEYVENGLPAAMVPRLTEIELREPDVNKFAALNRGAAAAASLSGVTRGELDRSLRQRELRHPSGFGDELRSVLTDSVGAYGALTVLRETASPNFTPAEVRFVASLAAPLAEGVRRATMLRRDRGDRDDEVGILVLRPDDTVEMVDRGARRWLEELGAGTDAARSRRSCAPSPPAPGEIGGPAAVVETDDGRRRRRRARVRTTSGRWIVVRGSLLGADDTAPVAVLLEAARPPELAPLIADAYAFTDRERLITELVAQGHSTKEISEALHLSAYTVQDHLKSIFDKSGTSSRGDLVARIFFDHYAPRLDRSAGRRSRPSEWKIPAIWDVAAPARGSRWDDEIAGARPRRTTRRCSCSLTLTSKTSISIIHGVDETPEPIGLFVSADVEASQPSLRSRAGRCGSVAGDVVGVGLAQGRPVPVADARSPRPSASKGRR